MKRGLALVTTMVCLAVLKSARPIGRNRATVKTCNLEGETKRKVWGVSVC
jgi:hypothetical protein